MRILALTLFFANCLYAQNYIGNAVLGNASIGGGSLSTNTPTPPDTSLTNLVPSGMGIWLRAATLTNANGTPVSFWSDESTNSSHATQGTAANRPTLDNGWVRFYSVSNSWMSAPHNAGLTNNGSGHTMWVVFKTNTIPATEGGTIEVMVAKGTNWLAESMHYSAALWNNQVAWVGSDVFNIGYAAYDPRSLSGTNLWLVEMETGATWTYKTYNSDGTTNTLSPTSSYGFGQNSDPLFIGTLTAWPYTSAGYNGWIREVIVWPRKLSVTERSNLFYYATH